MQHMVFTSQFQKPCLVLEFNKNEYVDVSAILDYNTEVWGEESRLRGIVIDLEYQLEYEFLFIIQLP